MIFLIEGKVAGSGKLDSGFNQEYEQVQYMIRYRPGFVRPERHFWMISSGTRDQVKLRGM